MADPAGGAAGAMNEPVSKPLSIACLLLLLLWLRPGAAQQANIADSERRAAQLVAGQIRDCHRDVVCRYPVHWVLAVDLSGSTQGIVLPTEKAILHELVQYVATPGDLIELLPFDDQVDFELLLVSGPARKRYELAVEEQAYEAELAACQTVIRELSYRPGRKNTDLDRALRTGLERIASAAAADPNRVAVLVLLSDTTTPDGADPLPTGSVQVPGVRLIGPDNHPYVYRCFHRQTPEGRQRSISVYHAISAAEPASAPAQAPPRLIPPDLPGAVSSSVVREEHPFGRVCAWLCLLAGLAFVGWAWAQRRLVHFHWGHAEGRSHLEGEEFHWRAGQSRTALYAAKRQAPWTVNATAFATEEESIIPPELGFVKADPEGLVIDLHPEHRVRLAGREGAGSPTLRIGRGREALLVFSTTIEGQGLRDLNQEPLGVYVHEDGRDWKSLLGVGVGLLVAGFVILALSRTREHVISQPPPRPAPFCQIRPGCIDGEIGRLNHEFLVARHSLRGDTGLLVFGGPPFAGRGVPEGRTSRPA